MEGGRGYLVPVILTFRFLETVEEWLADHEGEAVDDGVVQGGKQCGGMKEGVS